MTKRKLISTVIILVLTLQPLLFIYLQFGHNEQPVREQIFFEALTDFTQTNLNSFAAKKTLGNASNHNSVYYTRNEVWNESRQNFYLIRIPKTFQKEIQIRNYFTTLYSTGT